MRQAVVAVANSTRNASVILFVAALGSRETPTLSARAWRHSFSKIRSTIIKASTKLQRGFMRGRVAAHTLPAVFQKPNWENRNEHYVQI